MLFQHEAEAPPQTALTGRADNAQIHGHVWQPCVSHKPPRNKRCGKALVPALSPVPSPYARDRWVGYLPSLAGLIHGTVPQLPISWEFPGAFVF
jgi:hypothetical protein